MVDAVWIYYQRDFCSVFWLFYFHFIHKTYFSCPFKDIVEWAGLCLIWLISLAWCLQKLVLFDYVRPTAHCFNVIFWSIQPKLNFIQLQSVNNYIAIISLSVIWLKLVVVQFIRLLYNDVKNCRGWLKNVIDKMFMIIHFFYKRNISIYCIKNYQKYETNYLLPIHL